MPHLSASDTVLDDKLEIAEVLSTYFCSVFTQDNGSAPKTSHLEEILSIDDIFISEEGVLSLLLKLDTKKSPGIVEILNAFFVRYAE